MSNNSLNAAERESATAPAASVHVADEAHTHKDVGHRSHVAGAFDIRNVIGALLGLYGLVLLISFFVLDPGTTVGGESKDAVYNLWAGLAMVGVAVAFFLWSKFEPIKIDESAVSAIEADTPASATA